MRDSYVLGLSALCGKTISFLIFFLSFHLTVVLLPGIFSLSFAVWSPLHRLFSPSVLSHVVRLIQTVGLDVLLLTVFFFFCSSLNISFSSQSSCDETNLVSQAHTSPHNTLPFLGRKP